jgi:hypothetical protein
VAASFEAEWTGDLEGDNTEEREGIRTDKTRFGVNPCFPGEAVAEGVASTVALLFLSNGGLEILC